MCGESKLWNLCSSHDSPTQVNSSRRKWRDPSKTPARCVHHQSIPVQTRFTSTLACVAQNGNISDEFTRKYLWSLRDRRQAWNKRFFCVATRSRAPVATSVVASVCHPCHPHRSMPASVHDSSMYPPKARRHTRWQSIPRQRIASAMKLRRGWRNARVGQTKEHTVLERSQDSLVCVTSILCRSTNHEVSDAKMSLYYLLTVENVMMQLTRNMLPSVRGKLIAAPTSMQQRIY